ncbi:paired immunoglobulin-like type 2 receptor alpha [Emydura macquarii macquarii]|uniref:paired immunoglobulin-like type 2 receptor alpha n=1 Tax=Emydura macquarii macquarii TaxID=1129001 RepID=UPI00352AFA82
MRLPLGHPALLLLAGILRGVAAQDPRYQMDQPVSVSAPAGSCVTLPCNFTYPKDIEPVQDLRVYWRRVGFHGEFIYNHTEHVTHPDYRGRITLVGDSHGNRTASICIDRLRASDANFYFCFIRVQKNNCDWEQWRNVHGTKLTVTAGVPASTTSCPSTQPIPASTQPISASTQLVPDAMQPPGPGTAPVIGGALAGAVLLALLIGLAVYKARKRTGPQRKTPPAGREGDQPQAGGESAYMEVGARGQDVPPPQRPPARQEPGLLYAALDFAEPGAARRPPKPHAAPGGETLYSAVRVH